MSLIPIEELITEIENELQSNEIPITIENLARKLSAIIQDESIAKEKRGAAIRLLATIS